LLKGIDIKIAELFLEEIIRLNPVHVGWRSPDGEFHLDAGRPPHPDSYPVYVTDGSPGEPTLSHLVEYLRDRRDVMLQSQTDCRNCGHAIVLAGGRWTHFVNGKVAGAGCRAASVDRLGTWDDGLDPILNAEPSRR
jgi:hypothetical protein